MRLLIDARYVRAGFHDGISRYTASLLHALYTLKQQNNTEELEGIEIAMAISDPNQLTMLPPFPHLLTHSPTSILEPLSALILNRYHPDVLFSPMQTIGSWGRKFRLILTLHDLIYYSHPKPPSFLPLPIQWGWLLFHKTYLPQRLLLNRADAVATVSHTTADLIQKNRLTHRPVWVIPNAPQHPPTPSTTPLSHRNKQLIYMGSFMPYKNVETLLLAMQKLPDYTLHLLSRISPTRLTELKPLMRKNIVIHNGVSEEEYTQLLRESFALLTASKDEGYGLPVVEAQSAGCPVIISDIDIFREIAPHSLRFSPENSTQLVQQVRKLENKQIYLQAQEQGYDDVHRFSWHNSALELIKRLRELPTKKY
ncbi:glycosyltransferase family 1 protein [uncultured Rothia sp.]|uniref:glycosyltransferase family 4 protein n=1 Tax=uncultured Rothia sp. TaxID=316088 RepID=UPI0032170A2B